ncbi:MAG: TonB family protein [Myxococcota bacterium]
MVSRLCLVFVLLSAGLARADEAVRRELVDAGVHIPVLTKAPELLEFIEADYPPEAKAQGLTASVKLSVIIDETGAVSDAQVPEPVGNGFDEAAIAAVKRFRFSPAEVDFKPSPVQIEYVYHFVLKPPEPDAGVEAPPGEPVDAGVKLDAKLVGQALVRGSRGFVPGALVICDEYPDRFATADDQGNFSLAVPSGTCHVRVAAAGFLVFQTDEVLAPNETREVKYFLIEKADGMQTVVRGKRDKKEVVRRTISRDEVQKVPGTFGDPVRVIQNFPGVARAPFVLGQLIVRGANPAQTLTFFDGVEIPLLFHVAGGPSVVNAEFLDRLDFFPGGFGARYGRAVGGVVDVQSRKGASDTWHGSAKIDLLDTALFFQAPIAKDVSIAAAARRSYVDALIPLVLPQDPQGGSLLVLPVYWDYQVRLDVGARPGTPRADGASDYSLFVFGSDDQLKVVASGGARNRDVSVDFHTSFHRVVGGWTYRRGNIGFKLTPYVGYDLAKIDFGLANITANQWTAGLRQDLEVDVSKHFTLRAGADIYNQTIVGEAELPVISGVQFVEFPGSDPQLGTQRVAQIVNTFDGALYAEGDVKVGAFTVTPGVRLSQAFITGQTRYAADPRLWVRFEPWEKTAIKGSIGLYTQPPTGASLVDPPFGSPNLVHEKAFQSSLGVSHRFTEFINLDVTGFFNRRFDNIINQTTPVQQPDGSLVTYRQTNNGLGRAYGLEVLARHEVSKHFFGWIAYTLSRSEEYRAGRDTEYRVTQFDQTHILTVVGSVKLPYGFELGARFRYVTGQPKSPLIHDYDVYQADANSFSGTFGASRSARSKDFNQLDIRLDKYFVFERWTLDVYLDVQNVYWAKNVETTFYDYRFRQEFEVPGIPILPVLGVKASF